jgi:hypothetical protein
MENKKLVRKIISFSLACILIGVILVPSISGIVKPIDEKIGINSE